jgi:hypothetical protein
MKKNVKKYSKGDKLFCKKDFKIQKEKILLKIKLILLKELFVVRINL